MVTVTTRECHCQSSVTSRHNHYLLVSRVVGDTTHLALGLVAEQGTYN